MEDCMTEIAPGEYYHIYNRGVRKQDITRDGNDYARLLFTLLYFQSPVSIANTAHYIYQYTNTKNFLVRRKTLSNIIEERFVELVSFAIMPNHFHLIVKEVKPGGIAKYLQRVQNSYTKYFNLKHKFSGHLFEGKYKSVHVKDERHLMHLSAYIHRNPRELKKWKPKPEDYPWSSYQDFVKENRWGELLKCEILFGNFKSPKEYAEFVRSSPAKRYEEEFEIF